MKTNIIFLLSTLNIFILSCNIHCSDYEPEKTKYINILNETERNNNKQILDYYYKEVKDIDFNAQRKSDLKTALHIAVMNNNIELVNFLIKRNVHLNIRDTKGQTAFEYSLLTDNIPMLRILANCFNIDNLEYKFDDNIGKSIINKYKLDQTYRSIFQNILDTWLLKEIVWGVGCTDNPNYKNINYLISIGANINSVGNHFDRATGVHPLYAAVNSNNVQLTKYLISKGAWINIHFDDEPGDTLSGVTPLMRAIQDHYNEIALLLINNGADLNLGVNNHTPLSYSIEYQNIEIKNILLSKGILK